MSPSRVLLDTNVVLDLLLARAPFDVPAVALATAASRGDVGASLCATTITTIHYIARKQLGKAGAKQAVEQVLGLFTVAPVTEAVLRTALTRDFDDFEDAVLDAAAEHAGADAIVTRDATGFRTSALAVFSPTEMVQALAAR